MQLDKNLNPKHLTIIGAILAIVGFGYTSITGKADVIIVFFTLFLGLFLFFIGIAGWLLFLYRRRKNK